MMFSREKVREWLEAVRSVTAYDRPGNRESYIDAFFSNWQYMFLHFLPDTAHSLFHALPPGKLLANELIWAAVYYENGHPISELGALSEAAVFECGPSIRNPQPPGQLAVFTLLDGDTATHYLTDQFADTDVSTVIQNALGFSALHGVSPQTAFDTMDINGGRSSCYRSSEIEVDPNGGRPLCERITEQQAEYLRTCLQHNQAVGAIASYDIRQGQLHAVALRPENPPSTCLGPHSGMA